jgi:hypothetical protein
MLFSPPVPQVCVTLEGVGLRVLWNVTMSLDGFIVGPAMGVEKDKR